jgi:ATPase subunit of ABC transporter with duplicated ATPase domains
MHTLTQPIIARGKSTLLRILAGVEASGGGTLERPVCSGILRQEAPVDLGAAVRELIDDYTRPLLVIH